MIVNVQNVINISKRVEKKMTEQYIKKNNSRMENRKFIYIFEDELT